jgi:hypothetical protein
VSRQRRWRIVAGAGAVALGAVTTVLANDGTPGDALGVLGTLGGTPLAVATLAPLAALPLTVVAVIRLYWSACSRTARSATWPAVRSR